MGAESPYGAVRRAAAVLGLGMVLAGCGQATEAAPVQTERPAPGLAQVTRPRYAPTDFQAGAMVLVYGNDPGFSAKSVALLDRLARLGVNSVGFVFPIFQHGQAATSIYADTTKTPTDANITTFLGQAHRRGFTVIVRPLLDEQSPDLSGHWRGSITPADRAAWWQSYKQIILRYAQLSQAGSATFFDVGTELTTMEADTARWVSLAGAVHQVFSGELTYSANWDHPYPAFGRSLDFLAVDAWFPLAIHSGVDPVAAVTAAWKPWLDQVHGERVRFGKPLVFTELGLASQQGALTQPWAHLPNVPADNNAQREYYAGTCLAVKPNVAGMYWWDFELNAPPPGDTGFPPEGKPAEKEISRCYA